MQEPAMGRRTFLGTVAGGAAAAAGACARAAGGGAPAKRLNALWIMAEDISPDLACYGTPAVKTPNLDRLAAEGARYTNAFCTAPVCSPSRSAMITGMYQTTIGAHHHRSHRDDGYRPPPPVRLMTDYLREAGYWTCNVTTAAPGVRASGKTDFNFAAPKPFDGNDWAQRGPGQPFFAQLSLPVTHRGWGNSRPWCAERGLTVDPAAVQLPPYYPDHPVARDDWAHYLESIQMMDWQVGEILKRLKDEGLYDETVIFFIGDNGRCHVRGKQWLYEGGIHIPLLVRWPGVVAPGTVPDDLVLAIDISATVLAIAGLEPPAHLEGQVFLGPGARPPRPYVVAARDRCDETVDRIRCVRDKRYKYIRNFMPERPWTQPNNYKTRSYPMLRLMEGLHAEGKLTPVQDRWFLPRRPGEELYDLQEDPWEVRDLAGAPEHQERLARMRAVLEEWIQRTGDQGMKDEDPAALGRFLDERRREGKL